MISEKDFILKLIHGMTIITLKNHINSSLIYDSMKSRDIIYLGNGEYLSDSNDKTIGALKMLSDIKIY
jgi:hypothetical protein